MENKKIGLFDAILLVSGSMIGSGVFIVISGMARNLGNAYFVLLAWIITGLITLMASLSFGELASMMPNAGGQYTFITRIYGRITGFVYGWTVFMVIQTGVIAAVAMAFARYLGLLFPQLGENNLLLQDLNLGFFQFSISFAQLIAVLMIVILTYINTLGIQEGKWIQRVFTIAKFLALMLIVFGTLYIVLFPSVNTPTFVKLNFDSNFDVNQWNLKELAWEKISGYSIFIAFGAAMVGSLFSADAWQGITFMSTEVKSPVKNIPKALVYGTTLVTLVYVLVNLSYMVLLPLKGVPSHGVNIYDLGVSHAENNRVGAAAASAILGAVNHPYLGMSVMAIFILISTFGCNNGLILSGSRLFKAMSDEGLFFKQAKNVNSKGIPGNALWMQAIWAAILCLSGSYESLLNYCTFASLLFYIVTVAGLIILRIKEPFADRPYKVWGYPFIPVIYILTAGAIAIAILLSNFNVSITGLGIVLLGWPIYYLFNNSTQFKS